jgi:GntR family transcriptional regulator/MocR family aminotransferase
MSKQPPKHLASLIPLHEGDAAPLYRQMYIGLRRAILSGQLPPGTRLMASRALARELGVSRTTVLQAYEQLLAEGYLEGRLGAGTWVAAGLPEERHPTPPHRPGSAPPSPPAPSLSARGAFLLRAARADVAPFEPAVPGVRTFRVGLPALEAFPHEVWGRLMGRCFRAEWASLLAPQSARGYQPLREAVAAYLGVARGVRCTAEQVIIVAGSQQGLDLIAQVLLNPGDAAWIEDPGYLNARTALLGAGARLIPVPVDAEGFDLAAGLARCSDARLAYITPSHQFPLGMTMSVSRRLALLEWASRAGGWVIEDDYDSEFRYVGHPLASLQSLDEQGRVLYLGTFSKVLSPALRLGYLVVPPALVEAFTAARMNADGYAPAMEQAVLAEFMAQGHFARHLRRMRRIYAERQAALLTETSRVLGDMLHVTPDATGLHLVGWLPAGTDDQALARRLAAANVVAFPLSLFHLAEAPRPALLLGYAAASPAEIHAGIQQLANVYRSFLQTPRAR